MENKIIGIMLFLIITGCSNSKKVFLGSGFDKNFVEVWLVGNDLRELVFEGLVSTDEVTGIAEQIQWRKKKGQFIDVYILIDKKTEIILPISFCKRKENIIDVLLDENQRLKQLYFKHK